MTGGSRDLENYRIRESLPVVRILTVRSPCSNWSRFEVIARANMRSWIIVFVVSISAVATAQEIKQVDGADLAIGTRKYDGKTIEVAAKCYFADVEDYRCTTEASYSIFTKKVEPDEQRKFLDENCDTLKKAFLGASCAVKLRFKYEAANTKEDIVSGYQTRRVSRPNSVVVIRAAPAARPSTRRRR